MLFSLSLRIQVSLVTSSDGFDVFLWKVIKPSSLSASVPLCNSDTIVIDVKTYAIQADNIVGDGGAIDTTGTMAKDKLIDIYNRLIKQSDATNIPITK